MEEAELWRIDPEEWGDAEVRAARLAKIRSAGDMEVLDLPWEWALNCGFVEVDGARARAGADLPDEDDDAALLTAWQGAVAGAAAELSVALPLPAGPLGGLPQLWALADEAPPLVFLMLLTAYGLPEGEWLDVAGFTDGLEGLPEGPARMLVSALLAEQYEETAGVLELFGAAEREGGETGEGSALTLLLGGGGPDPLPAGRFRLTPLGRSGLHTLLVRVGIPAPVIGSLAEADARELLASLPSYASETDAAKEVADWLAARSAADAAVQVVDACVGTEPADALRRLEAPRVLAAVLETDTAGRAQQVLHKAAVSTVTGCSHAAASMLRRIGEPAEGEAAWGLEWMLAGAAWAAVFAPAEAGQPARLGRLVFYRPSATVGRVPAQVAAPGTVERVRLALVLPHGRGVRTRTVEGWALSPGNALALLLDLPASGVHPSLAAWAAVARRALELLGEGRLYPALTSDTYTTWRFGPPGARGKRDLDALAAALPPYAHNLPAPPSGDRTPRIVEPAALVREFCDALADTLSRTPAAGHAVPGNPYADRASALHPKLAQWAAEAAAERAAQVSVELRVEPPAGRRRDFRAVLQLRTAADPSLVLDAAELWADPVRAQRLLGPHAEAEALLALRRAARAWQPLTRLLAEAAPSALGLDDEEAMELLGDATDALRTAGVRVHWPRELVKDLQARGEVGAATAPGATVGTLLGRDALLDFSWHVALGGEKLTEAELELLAESRRPLVRLREQWVVADPKLVARLRRRRTGALAPLEALQAVLTGEMEWAQDGERVAVEAAGAFADLVAQLRDPESRAPVAYRRD